MTGWGTFGYCEILDVESAADPCVHASERYLAALYWSLGIILGFAATPEAGPYEPIAHSADDRRNFLNSETVMCVLLQFFGCWLWTYVLACCVDVVAGNDPDALEARQQKLALNRFCSFFKLPSSTSKRLREYFRERKALQMARGRQQILGFMSPGLQAELAWSVNERWLKKIVLLNKPLEAILNNCPQPFVHECPLKIHQYECPRREECIRHWHRMPIWGSNPGISDQRLVSQTRVRAPCRDRTDAGESGSGDATRGVHAEGAATTVPPVRDPPGRRRVSGAGAQRLGYLGRSGCHAEGALRAA